MVFVIARAVLPNLKKILQEFKLMGTLITNNLLTKRMKITLILLSAFSILSCQTKKHNQNLEAQSTLSEKDIVSKKDHSIKTIP